MTPLVRAGVARSGRAGGGGGGGSPPEEDFIWTPARITTQLWFDADDAATITIATGVSQWNDKSGNGRNVVQATGGNQPSVQANNQNGHDIIRFDGNDYLRGTSGLTGLAQNIGTVYLASVRKWPSPPAVTASMFLIANNSTATRSRLDGGRTANKPGAGGRRLDADSFAGIVGGTDVPNAWQVHDAAFNYTAASVTQWINGTQDGSGTVFSAGSTSNTAPGEIVIGGLSTGSDMFTGDIGELIATHVITTYQRQMIEGYLAWRWGIQTSLPTTHPYRYRQPEYGDASFASVVFLAHYEGPDGSTAAVQDCGVNQTRTPTVVATAQIDTAQFPPITGASSSLLLDGNSDYVTYPDSADWDFDTGDFTIEFWVRHNSLTGNQTYVAQYDASSSQRAWLFLLNSTGVLQYFHTTDGTTGTGQSVQTAGSWASVNTWYHLAVSRSGTTLRLFIDGTLVNTNSSAGGNVFNSNQPLYVGSRNGGSDAWLNGWIADVRITKGVARYTASFTRPTRRFANAI